MRKRRARMGYYRVYSVDAGTWADSYTIDGFIEAKVTRSLDGGLIESGTLTFDSEASETFSDGYYRVARMDDGVRTDIATLLCRADGGTNNRGRRSTEVIAYSVLKPAGTMRLIKGEYAPSGADGAAFAADMLRGCIAAPVVASDSFRISGNIVFDIGSTVLDAVWKVLDAGGFTMQVTGDGAVAIIPKDTAEAVEIGAQDVESDIKRKSTVLSVPNRYTAVDGIAIATALNDDADSVTSTVAVGYIVDEVDTSPSRIENETLSEYARRKLAEVSVVSEEFSYGRSWVEGVLPGSRVRASFISTGELFTVKSQEIECGPALKVTETICREVRTWPISG